MALAKTIDVAEFNRIFSEKLPDQYEKTHAKAVEKASMAGMPVPLFDSKLDLGGFCAMWPKVEQFINMAVSVLGWFMPGPAAMAKAFIAAFKTAVLPILCAAPPPAE